MKINSPPLCCSQPVWFNLFSQMQRAKFKSMFELLFPRQWKWMGTWECQAPKKHHKTVPYALNSKSSEGIYYKMWKIFLDCHGHNPFTLYGQVQRGPFAIHNYFLCRMKKGKSGIHDRIWTVPLIGWVSSEVFKSTVNFTTPSICIRSTGEIMIRGSTGSLHSPLL